MFRELEDMNSRPRPFEFYTAKDLWTDKHTSKKMLEYHLNESLDLASRNPEFIDRSASWIISHFGVGVNTAIADFGCGPGLYTTRFAEQGADALGIDFSERSIRYANETAERKSLSVDYLCQDYLAFDTDKRFDLITMIWCDFCALSPTQRRDMLGKFHRLLGDGGSVLMDVHSLNVFDQKEQAATYELNQLDGFWSPTPYYSFLNTFKYEEEKVFLDKYTIIEEDRTRTVYNWIQCFSPESLRAEFEENGLEVEELWADVAGTPFNPDSTEFAVVATCD
jgi:cyclopropane fatty-acyl-phospholipid synthase-like methyltransferase